MPGPESGADLNSTWRVICALAWHNQEFKTRLKDHADEVLAEFGFDAPPGMSYNVIESDENVITLVLPAPPDAAPVVGAADHKAVSQYYASCI